MSVNISECDPAKARIVLDILQESVNWLIQTERTMWSLDDVSEARVYPDVERGLFFVAMLEGKPAGVMKYQTEDLFVWPEITDGKSAFIHRLAVRRCFAGQGISDALIRFAADRALASGKVWLRLDCAADRPKLRAVYEKYGFALHSICQVDRYNLARYELALHLG